VSYLIRLNVRSCPSRFITISMAAAVGAAEEKTRLT